MKACGQAFEYLLHCHFRPTINCYARTIDGRYRERPPERSKSKAALGATRYSDLFKAVLGVWLDLETVPEPAPGESRVADYTPFGRVVFPASVLDIGSSRASLRSVELAGQRPLDGPVTLTADSEVTFGDIASVASELTGRDIRRVVVDDNEWVAGQVAHGTPEFLARFLLGTLLAAREGHF